MGLISGMGLGSEPIWRVGKWSRHDVFWMLYRLKSKMEHL